MLGMSLPGQSENRVPVLLELFTSEGCSSCPPADDLLARLDREQPVQGAELIVVSEHVDYWNHLGWADPYSSPVFSQRQQEYSQRLGSEVYTPQLVVDGKAELVGSIRAAAFQAIEKAAGQPKAPLTVRVEGTGKNAKILIEAPSQSKGTTANVFVVTTRDATTSKVLRGENQGRKLSHVAVAREIKNAGKWKTNEPLRREVTLELPQHGENPRVIVFVQDPASGAVLGVTHGKFSPDRT